MKKNNMANIYSDNNGNILLFNGGAINAPETPTKPTELILPASLSGATVSSILRVDDYTILYVPSGSNGTWLYDAVTYESVKLTTSQLNFSYSPLRTSTHVLICVSASETIFHTGIWSYDIKNKTLSSLWSAENSSASYPYYSSAGTTKTKNNKYLLQPSGTSSAGGPLLLYDPELNSITQLSANKTSGWMTQANYKKLEMDSGNIVFYPTSSTSPTSYIIYLFKNETETLVALNDSEHRYSTNALVGYKLDGNYGLVRNNVAYDGLYNYVVYDDSTESLSLIYSEDTQVNGSGTYYFQKLNNGILMGSNSYQYPLRYLDINNQTATTLYTSSLTSGTFTWRFLRLNNDITLMTVDINNVGIIRYDESLNSIEEIITTNTLNTYIYKMTDNKAAICGTYLSIYNDNTKTATNSTVSVQYSTGHICQDKLALVGNGGVASININTDEITVLLASGSYSSRYVVKQFNDSLILSSSNQYQYGVWLYNGNNNTLTTLISSGSTYYFNIYKELSDNIILLKPRSSVNGSTDLKLQSLYKYDNSTKQATFYAQLVN